MRRLPVFVAALFIAAWSAGGTVLAQGRPTGYVSVFADYFPNRDDTVELRPRVFAEEKIEPSSTTRLTFAGFAEALVARRPVNSVPERVTDAAAGIQDANIDVALRRLDLLAGYARVVWGTLDEIQPTDVINPLDVSRFFFDGRNEARLAVLLLRARLHVSDTVSIEGIYVPDFRRGRFDQLDEPTSPFNITTDVGNQDVVCLAIGCPALPLPIDDREPVLTWRTGQGGARFSATTGRVDWSISAYRGYESFGLYTIQGAPPSALTLVYPRYTMVGGDFEAVRGDWGIRGEGAVFIGDNFQSSDLRVTTGHSVDAGVGVDRRAGDYTVSATVLVHSEAYDAPLADRSDGRTDMSFVLSADRTLARERYRLRVFGVYNPNEASAFIRGIALASLRDNVALEGSLGWFAGAGRDLVGRFADSDFAYVRLKYYF
jgi:Protein of unknown function (DUF1302)